MKKRLIALCVALLLAVPAAGTAELDLGSMSFEELTELQTSVEQEMRTRNVKKLDLKSLQVGELEELMLQCLIELCSRPEAGEDVHSGMKFMETWLTRGVMVLFTDTNSNLFTLMLSDDNVERMFKTTIEQTVENVAQIEIPGK